jgi:hypothetical protein
MKFVRALLQHDVGVLEVKTTREARQVPATYVSALESLRRVTSERTDDLVREVPLAKVWLGTVGNQVLAVATGNEFFVREDLSLVVELHDFGMKELRKLPSATLECISVRTQMTLHFLSLFPAQSLAGSHTLPNEAVASIVERVLEDRHPGLPALGKRDIFDYTKAN